MIPVVMLMINIGALSSDFLCLFCLTMARRSLLTYSSHLPDGGCSDGYRAHSGDESPVLSCFPRSHAQRHHIDSFGTFLVNQHLCNLHHNSKGMVRSL
jgi:hypothetical protein